MDYGRIEKLLDKFWECGTTPEEESELRHFFNECDTIPAHLKVFREVFVWQAEEKTAGLDEDFDKRVLMQVKSRGYKLSYYRKLMIRIAACLLLGASVGGLLYNRAQSRMLPQEEMTPQQALAEVKKALAFVSEKMNEGEQLVEVNMKKANVATQYIK